MALCLQACTEQEAAAPVPEPAPRYDGVILNGTVYDGSGAPGVQADVAIDDGRIVALGDFDSDNTKDGGFTIDASGKAVAPGFINMLSWALDSLIHDGRSQGDIRQGVTLEVFGEGESWGPWNDTMKAEEKARQSDITYDIEWTSLGEFLEYLEQRGVSTNVASFVGATTVRVHEVGYEDRAPTAEELERMQALVRQGMEEGALGVGSSLIYAPAYYASTEELIALTSVAAEYGGMYISHMRSEGNRLLEAIDELITIARESGAPAEIYHFKQSGESNWSKFDEAVAKIEQARAEGLRISADMYTYTAGSTGLDAAMPPWVQEGGYADWRERLQNPEVRAKLQEEMLDREADWSNLMLAAGPEGTLLVGFRNPELRKYTGRTLSEVAEERGTNPQQTAMDLVIEDGSRVQVVYFLMSEENVKRGIALPWMSFGSDAYSMAPEGVFLNSSTHPRAYGNFARLLGRYVRDEQVIPLAEAIRKMTSLPAAHLGLRERGSLVPGYHADVVVFDPDTINDVATYDDPHRYAVGVSDVIVNGVQVLQDGEHTGATPGQVVRGPGWTGWQD
ncbi:D-aminoacylase [Parahaliea maris]|uniref:D-aminoacylase n=2 Tax=Parahaliea maris TaxID=2716870 RepID=A0A5C8ZX10_9GAMM|nr:D-aminoacylase [Parahaliea maris]